MKRFALTLVFGFLIGCETVAPNTQTTAPPTTLPSTNAPAIPAEKSVATGRKHFTLTLENYWRLELPNGRFDASGLVFDGNDLLVISDEDTTPYKIILGETNSARLQRTEIFTAAQLRPFLPEKRLRWDFEGLARDDRGRIYVCEEANRWILRWDPVTKITERLPIDWTPVRRYFSTHPNASFEGIAIGGGHLWVANERERARIIDLDLDSLKILSDFAPEPADLGFSFFLHYSDLCWRDGKLFILARHHRVILEVDPATHAVLAEYSYAAIEDAAEHEYQKELPTGIMEGLAIDDKYFWLVTDNNGLPRRASPRDTRPTLFKCPRP